jgi:hypothetical protein
LSPAVGELLSGATPPLAFFNPIVFLFLGALYGSGALLIREYARRWGKGWRSILLMGAAYGIIEEGILVRSFFNPGWKDLGVLGSYGRWLGVNWVWAEWLSIYHAIFSITIPIFLVELYYPQLRAKPWLTAKQTRLFQGALLASVIAGFVGFPYYAPELLIWLPACVMAVGPLFWIAKRLPNVKTVQPLLTKSWRSLSPLGFTMPFEFFFLFTSGIIPIPALTMVVGILGVLGFEKPLEHWSRKGFTDSQRFGLVAGALSFFIFLDGILELGGKLGMSGVGAGFLFLVIMTRRRINLGIPRIGVFSHQNAEFQS